MKNHWNRVLLVSLPVLFVICAAYFFRAASRGGYSSQTTNSSGSFSVSYTDKLSTVMVPTNRTTSMETAQKQADVPTAEATESLKSFLRTLDTDRTARYMAAFRDLNGDGIQEAIVYLISNQWCGSGGCSTLILAPDNGSWRIVTNIRITRPPIYVLSDVSNGWHSIAVSVQGGGIQAGYEAELQFNGSTYPNNPSVSPARRLTAKPVGEVVIPSIQDGETLYNGQAIKNTGP